MVDNVLSLLIFKLLFLAQIFLCWTPYCIVGENPAFQLFDQTHKTLHNYSIFDGNKKLPKYVNKYLQAHTFVALSYIQSSNGDAAHKNVKKQISALSAEDHIPECPSHDSLAQQVSSVIPLGEELGKALFNFSSVSQLCLDLVEE